jgi:predicted signal transduction protein with EAL and GGDEF domain
MKLAEALALRSDASKRYEQLRSRAQANARYQEGEPPAENAAELLAEADRVLAELEDLIRRINRTNAATSLDAELTVTDAIAQRDVLRLRHALYTSVADAASGKAGPGMVRQMRSELRYVAAVSVSELRTAADETAKQHRELDVRIQRANWETDLVD